MLQPARDGSNAFARFLTAQAVSADLDLLPPALRRPGTVAYFMNAPHDKACVLSALDTLVTAMVEGDAARAR
jgi:hypothetical protein